MGTRRNHTRATGVIAGVLAIGTAYSTAAEDFMPLPGDPGASVKPNPVIDLTDKAIRATGDIAIPTMPEQMTIENEGGEILYDNNNRVITYVGKGKPVRLRTNTGVDIQAQSVKVNLDAKTAELQGPMTVYLGDTLTKAGSGVYDWANMKVDIRDVRAKVSGIIVRGSRIVYDKDAEGKQYMQITDAYVSTDDSQEPDTWVGAGELTVYPGDYGRVTRLSVAGGNHDIAIPIIGWFTFSHSLNPREGYLPQPGAKSIWGAYLLNQYGFLIGNRRVKNSIPTADYLLTTRLDYRTRRGIATGLDFEDLLMSKKHKDMKGLRLYYAADSDPMINPTETPREQVDHNRYSIKLSSLWDLPQPAEDHAAWTLGAHVEVLSDQYMLRDFFEDEGHINERPDNTVRLTRRDARSEAMLWTRFAPNDYYSTDERIELTYYRARTTIGNTGINYETRNSFGAMRQEIPPHEMFMYRAAFEETSDPDVRNYYERMMNTSAYLRANSTHEFTASTKAFGFLNITPKVGVGYSGYYGVDGVGSDNRFIGYAAVDVSFKLHKSMPNFSLPYLGYKGLTHVIRPYTTLSYCNISSSNPLVPRVDDWSTLYGNSTNSPMCLDLMGFSGIDGWGTWTIWRLGMQNTLTTTVDGEARTILNWNVFIDINEENPNSNNRFSNVFSHLRFQPTRRLSLHLETQTPTIKDGDGFSQYNTYIAYQPTAYFEGIVGHRALNNHPIQQDTSQVYAQANLRFNEHYSMACQWNWDIENGNLPIQQYSIFRKTGAWYTGATLFLRDNGGKKETGFGISFTLGETGSALPINFF
ncbi:MAG: hypothetical protein E7031_03820 [Akkermansiaceae bacterium]|nr:hypothetical protein [Akkermansiaceae bacterium]